MPNPSISTDHHAAVDELFGMLGGASEGTAAVDVSHLRAVIKVEAQEAINYAMIQSGVPVITALHVNNPGDVDIPESMLLVRLSSPLVLSVAKELQIALPLIPVGVGVRLSVVDFTPEVAALVQIDEAVPAELVVELSVNDQRIASTVHYTRLLAYTEFFNEHGLHEIIAAHVLPNHPAVIPVLQAAGSLLQQRTGSSDLEGYQNGPKRVLQIAEAIYDALRAQKIGYINPPASFELSGQKVRTPEQVLGEQLGTCIDLACTYAACVEQAGLFPAMYFIAGHAYAGVFTNEEAAISQNASILVHDHVVTLEDAGFLVPLDAVSFTTGANETFREAVARGRSHLRTEQALHSLVNIRRARLDGILPLPSRVVSGGQVTVIVHEAPDRGGTATIAPQATSRAPRATKADQAPPRVQRWKADLLDLSLRNPLLQMSTRTTGLELLPAEGSLDLLEDMLTRGDAIKLLAHDELTLLHRQRGARTAADIDGETRLKMLAESGMMFVDSEEAKLRARLRALMSKARAAEEESGTNVLHLALGSLRWIDPKSDKAVRSPVLLLPVNLRSAGRGRPVEMVIDATGEATNNYCLLQKLRATFDLHIPELEVLVSDGSGIDVRAAIDGLRRAIAHNKLDMRVDEDAVVGLFQFGKFRMWKDLEDHWEQLLQNPVVRHLVEHPEETFTNTIPLPTKNELDTDDHCCPIPVDGAQLEAVVAAGRGSSFVLEGPPGTGKSQTITNLIANALANGKRVLFVAEKRAALEVVKRRLEAVGLGAFCLDIHGKDSSPKSLREQLLRSLEAHHEADLERWGEVRREINTRSDVLRNYVTALHNQSALGMSAWSARQRVLQLDTGPALPIPVAFLQSSTDSLREVTRAVAELPEAARAADWTPTHLWRLSGLTDVPLIDRQALSIAIDHLRSTISSACIQSFSATLGELLNAARSVAELEALARVVRSVESGHPVTYEGTRNASNPAWKQATAEARAASVAYKARFQAVYRTFKEEFFTSDIRSVLADAHGARDSFFLFRNHRLKKIASRLQPFTLRAGLTSDRVVAQLEQAVDAQKALTAVNEKIRHVTGLILPASWMPFHDDAERLFDEAVLQLNHGVPLLPIREGSALQHFLDEPGHVALGAADAIEPLAQSIQTLLTQLQSSGETITGWLAGRPLLPALAEALPLWSEESNSGSFIGLARYTRVLALLTTTRSLGLTTLHEELTAGRLTPAAAPQAFARGLAESSLGERLATGGLVAFDALAHNRIVSRLSELQKEDSALLEHVVPSRLLATRPFRAGQRFGEVGELARNELSRQKGGLSIRGILRKYSRATIELTPCLLMSPDSVAQFLEPGVIEFDLVVFDEASQVPVSNAIGAMGRGKSVVIVGDSRQMPPTAYFTGGVDSEQAQDTNLLEVPAEDLESILSECVGSGLPRLWLSWHYRSQDESLIAFSNNYYYEGRLSSFPAASAGQAGRGVSWRRVADGVFDRGATRTNRREAEAIVDHIQERLRDLRLARASIGVVTLNLEQCELVVSLLEARAASDAALEAVLSSDDPSQRLFVKNLESVQGDERDVILLSVGFAKDAKGLFSMNFGPLNRTGGERRWNVAVTRARQEVIIFSSIDPEAIELGRVGPGATGVRHLRAYLELARDGYARAGDLSSRHRTSDSHRDQIATHLRAAGLHVETDVGLSAFKVDLAISLPDAPDARLVAILLDGPGYAARHTVQDRDALPKNVLEHLMGWPAIMRIWLPEWMIERERVVREVVAQVHAAQEKQRAVAQKYIEQQRVVTTATVIPTIEAPAATPPEKLEQAPPVLRAAVVAAPPRKVIARRDPEDQDFRPYKSQTPVGDRTVLDFSRGELDRAIVRRVLSEVLDVEGPVEVVRLAKLVGKKLGLQRVAESRQAAIWSCIPRKLVRASKLGRFVWAEKQLEANWTGFRRTPEGCDRSYEEIAPEELCNAMVYFVRRGISMSEEGMLQELAEVFRVSRITSGFRDRMLSVLKALIRDKALRREDDRILLP